MTRWLIWTGDEDWEMEYQVYSGTLMVGSSVYYETSSIIHCEDGEVLMAVI